MRYYKFLDVGCKVGGSLNIASRFGYKTKEGLGIDVNKTHVNNFIKQGGHAFLADATDLPFKDNFFELSIFHHVLEHLPNKEEGFKALSECIRVSKKHVFIALPFFDEDKYLNSLNLKTFYSNWHGHTNMVTLFELKEFLKDYNYEVTMVKPLTNSSSPEIIPIDAPIDSGNYDPEKHGPKPQIKFSKNIWREYSIIINK